MEITQIDTSHLMIFYASDELSEPPSCINSATASRLCRAAMKEAGFYPYGNLKIDAYIQKEGILFFTERCKNIPLLYHFKSLDNTIGAAHALNQVCAPPSILFYYREEYYLALWEQQEIPTLLDLHQFGNIIPNVTEQLSILSKHGTMLFPECAVSSIAKWFHF